MILSFHPLFEGDKQMIVAGREPGDLELSAIRAADAVILPQGCTKALYRMSKTHCPFVFPNYDARFAYPGKLGQIALFRETDTLHPRTMLFADIAEFEAVGFGNDAFFLSSPFVFKFDWGGEGDTVFLVENIEKLDRLLDLARKAETSGQKGFLLQEYVESGNETLRVVILYDRLFSYWRRNPGGFYATLSKGAIIDKDLDPGRQQAGKDAVRAFCGKTGIDLAGIDLIFSTKSETVPLFLEVNYFFGRQGIGGSEFYYDLLITQIIRWLAERGLTCTAGKQAVKTQTGNHGSF